MLIRILIILFPLGLFAQSPLYRAEWNPDEVVAAENLLLDDYPGAVAAYSLRYLSTAFGDSAVIRVRRSSDDAEQDFTPTEITDGTLTTFTGAGEGFVVTWYDQSGNNHDVTIFGSDGKRIVNFGSIENINSLPSINFGINTDYLSFFGGIGITGTQNRTIIAVVDITTNTSRSIVSISDNTGGPNRQHHILTPELGVRIFGSNEIYAVTHTGHSLITNVFSGTTMYDNSMYLNGSSIIATSAGSDVTMETIDDYLLIGGGVAVASFDGQTQEIIIYDSDQSSNRIAIEADINTYYSIY